MHGSVARCIELAFEITVGWPPHNSDNSLESEQLVGQYPEGLSVK